MRYLLDTHTLIWYSQRSSKLSQKAEEIIDDPENAIYVSSASLWEIAIKISLGKLDLSFGNLLDRLEMVGFSVLQTDNVYLQKLLELPQIHKDPFDRLIIATTQAEDMILISADENIRGYDVRWVW
jgi:PIN domain nuclease of toxin-antitoxin system